jgi:hypothetical protein
LQELSAPEGIEHEGHGHVEVLHRMSTKCSHESPDDLVPQALVFELCTTPNDRHAVGERPDMLAFSELNRVEGVRLKISIRW